MENKIIERDKQSREFIDFFESTNKHLNQFLTCIGWSENSIENVEPPIICPFDASHNLYANKLEKHLEKCQWKAEGYEDTDLPLSIPSVSLHAPSCITFDEQLQEHVLQLEKLKNPSFQMGTGGRLIPRTSDRLIADFTTEERKILYDYTVANTVQPDIGDDIADLNKPQDADKNKTSSYLELLAQERNLKRRRAKHRGVHTNKKSQIEIFREVINQQMEMFAEYIAEKNDCRIPETEDHSSYTSMQPNVKDNSNYERKKSFDRDNYDFNDKYSNDHRSRSSTNDDYYNKYNNKRDISKSHHEITHSKHKKKSSKDHDRNDDYDSKDRKHKHHKKHHTKHHHRDKDERHRSRERESTRHLKKSKYNDRKNDKRRN